MAAAPEPYETTVALAEDRVHVHVLITPIGPWNAALACALTSTELRVNTRWCTPSLLPQSRSACHARPRRPSLDCVLPVVMSEATSAWLAMLLQGAGSQRRRCYFMACFGGHIAGLHGLVRKAGVWAGRGIPAFERA